MSEIFFSRRRSPASLRTPAVVFVCLGRRVGISKTRFSAEDMRRIGSLFAICRLRYREPTGRPSRKCIVQRCGGMNVWLCDDSEWALRGAAQLRALASGTNKSGDLGPAIIIVIIIIINHQVLAVSGVLVPACPAPDSTPPPPSGRNAPSCSAPLRNQVRSHDRHWFNRCWNRLSWLLAPRKRFSFPLITQRDWAHCCYTTGWGSRI